MHPFSEYASCTCAWATWGHICKHQIMIILMVNDVTQEDVIEYCGTWYRSNHSGLPIMFVNPKHIPCNLDLDMMVLQMIMMKGSLT
jgi:hypothetical protein